MVEEEDLKHWRDAGHVARRTLDGVKDETVSYTHLTLPTTPYV